MKEAPKLFREEVDFEIRRLVLRVIASGGIAYVVHETSKDLSLRKIEQALGMVDGTSRFLEDATWLKHLAAEDLVTKSPFYDVDSDLQNFITSRNHRLPCNIRHFQNVSDERSLEAACNSTRDCIEINLIDRFGELWVAHSIYDEPTMRGEYALEQIVLAGKIPWMDYKTKKALIISDERIRSIIPDGYWKIHNADCFRGPSGDDTSIPSEEVLGLCQSDPFALAAIGYSTKSVRGERYSQKNAEELLIALDQNPQDIFVPIRASYVRGSKRALKLLLANRNIALKIWEGRDDYYKTIRGDLKDYTDRMRTTYAL